MPSPATPSETTLGGRPATSVRLALDTERMAGQLTTCTDGTYTLWKLPLGATEQLRIEMSERVWVLGTASGPLVVTAIDGGTSTAADQQAIQRVLDSLEITP